jgi:hypothetical protein
VSVSSATPAITVKPPISTTTTMSGTMRAPMAASASPLPSFSGTSRPMGLCWER